MTELLKTQTGRLRILAFLEGSSLLLILFVTMPMKYIFQMPEANMIVGMVHGVFFLMYVYYVILVKIEQNWKFSKMALALIASVIPFGTFWADAKLFRV
jgi:integral membrane protein